MQAARSIRDLTVLLLWLPLWLSPVAWAQDDSSAKGTEMAIEGEAEPDEDEDVPGFGPLRKYEPLGQSQAGDRALVERAIANTNEMLISLGYRTDLLVAGWQPAKIRWPYISVSLNSAKAGQAYSPAEALASCRCVEVDTRALLRWLRATNYAEEFKKSLSQDSEYLLIFVLLHEVGHIRNGDISYKFDGIALGALNLKKNLDKDREKFADAFSASVVARSQSSLPTFYRRGSGHGFGVKVALSNLWVSLDSPLSTTSTFRFGEHKLLGDPSYYWDASESHPNLRWRVRSALNMIEGGQWAEILEEFETMRKQVSPDLYRANKSEYENAWRLIGSSSPAKD